MSWYQRWRNVFRQEPLDREIENELRYHLAETADRLTDSGMPRDQAVHEARRRLGNYSAQKERTRDMNVAAWLDQARADVLYGVRQLRLNPGFTAIAVLSLALGIGANTAIFQLVNAIRLKLLPVRDPQQLVSIDFEKGATRAGSWWGGGVVATYPIWDAIRREQQAFSGVLAWSPNRFNLTNGGEPRYTQGLYVSGSFFPELGVHAIVGRTLTVDDDTPACNAAAVVSYPFWQREFGGDPDVLTRSVSVDGHKLPVIGVTPPTFFGLAVGSRYDVAIPLCAARLFVLDGRDPLAERTTWWLTLMGRLKPGWTVQRALANLHAISPAVMRATLPPDYRPNMAKSYLANQLTALPADTGVSGLRQQYERPLWLLMATTGLVLLIACANLANLLLARATVRAPEIAVRLAIGASRWRLVRQLLAESMLLAVAGAALGAWLALALSRALVAFISTPGNPVFVDMALDWRVLAFTAAVAVFTCLLFGLLPALRATYLSPVTAMHSGARATPGRERFGLRRALVASQVALSLVLLFGALLFVRSLHNLLTVDPGFEPQGILTVQIDFSRLPHAAERRPEFDRQFDAQLAALPGVLSAAQVSFSPLSGGAWDNLVAPDGAAASVSGKQCYFSEVGPRYFRTMGTRLIAGREFDERDAPALPKTAIVNQAFARRFFAGVNPVGHTFHRAAGAGEAEPVFQIVGLVANTKYGELREDFKPIAFLPIAQTENHSTDAMFVLRTAGGTAGIMHSAKAAVEAMSPSIGIEFHSLWTQIEDSLMRERLMATLSGAFGFLAGLLAMLGLYGVIAYMVARRRNEIGVRIALGADHANILRLVLREALLLLAAGLAAGTVIALCAGTAAATLLFGLRPYDPVSLAGAGALLAAVALFASYVPARRAAALDPMATLRNE